MTLADRILLRRCATCSTHFEHGEGGTCVQCGQVFCLRHLHGPLAFIRRRLRAGSPVCRDCRRNGHRRRSES